MKKKDKLLKIEKNGRRVGVISEGSIIDAESDDDDAYNDLNLG